MSKGARWAAVAVGLALAILVALLVFNGFLTTETDRPPEAPLAIVVISNQYIPANQPLDPLVKRGVLIEARIPIEVLEDGAITDLDDLAEMMMTTPIVKHEQISASRLVES